MYDLTSFSVYYILALHTQKVCTLVHAPRIAILKNLSSFEACLSRDTVTSETSDFNIFASTKSAKTQQRF